MPLTERRRQEILISLEKNQALKLQLEQQLEIIRVAEERNRLSEELEKCTGLIRQLETELSGQPGGEEQTQVWIYLEGLHKEFEKEEQWKAGQNWQETEPGFSTVPPPTVYPAYRKRPPTPLVPYLAHHKFTLLAGPSGAGKSVTLRNLVKFFRQFWSDTARTLHEGAELLPEEWCGLIPVYAHLSNWHDSKQKLPDFLQEQVKAYGGEGLALRLPDLMRAGRVVLFLDGLDEFPQVERNFKTEQVDDPRARAIANLTEWSEWGEVSCVVTCRENLFAGRPGWHVLYLLSFSPEQVTKLAEKFYQDNPVLKAGLLAALYENLAENGEKEKLVEQLTRPFYLTKLLPYYARTGALPEHPVQLVDAFVKERLEGAVAEKRLEKSEAEKLSKQLGWMAFHMFEAREMGRINREGTVEELFLLGKKQKTQRFWEAAANTGFVIGNEKQVQFAHPILQTYFCACYCLSETLNSQLLFRATSEFEFCEVWRFWAALDKDKLVEKLIQILQKNISDQVQQGAAKALGYIADKRAVEPLTKILKSEAINLRFTGAYALGRIGDRRAVEPMLQLLDDPIREVRLSAIIGLGLIYDGRVFEPLLKVVRGVFQRQEPTRIEIKLVGEAFVRLENLVIIPLIARLKQEDSGLRPWIFEVLGQMGEPAVDYLIKLLDEKDPQLRAKAADVLGLIGDERAFQPLTHLLNDPDNTVRLNVIRALGEFGSKALPLLIQVLQLETGPLRASAAEALGQSGDKQAIAPLIQAIGNGDAQLRWSAVKALYALGDEQALPILRWLQEYDTNQVFDNGEFRKVRNLAGETIKYLELRSQSAKSGV